MFPNRVPSAALKRRYSSQFLGCLTARPSCLLFNKLHRNLELSHSTLCAFSFIFAPLRERATFLAKAQTKKDSRRKGLSGFEVE